MRHFLAFFLLLIIPSIKAGGAIDVCVDEYGLYYLSNNGVRIDSLVTNAMQYFEPEKGGSVRVESVTDRAYGGDYALGYPLEEMTHVVIGIPGRTAFHDAECRRAILSQDPEAKVVFFPWDFSEVIKFADTLGINFIVAPVSGAEIYGYYYFNARVPFGDTGKFYASIQTKNEIFWFAAMSPSGNNVPQPEKKYSPPGLGQNSIAVTTCDSTGMPNGPAGPGCEFFDYWEGMGGNHGSYTTAMVSGAFSLVRRQLWWKKILGYQPSLGYVRNVVRQMAGKWQGWESHYGQIDMAKLKTVLLKIKRQRYIKFGINKNEIIPNKKIGLKIAGPKPTPDPLPEPPDSSLVTPKQLQSIFVFIGSSVPEELTLAQNYPNPFNPTTTVEYALPKAGEVTITVYNIAGQAIQTLYNGYQEAGYHKINWDASATSAGLYFLEVRSGNFTKMIKMTLVK